MSLWLPAFQQAALWLLAGLAFTTPCWAEPQEQAPDYTLHLPGVAGEMWLDRQFIGGLREGGYKGTLTIHDWTQKDPGFGALVARKRNQQEAQKLAEQIEAMLTRNPNAKIRLIGHSGGTGIAAWALERLPEGMMIETLIFVAPALSQRYDLSKALSHVRGKAYAFTSANDIIVLGVGTRLLGTIDGVREEASGLRGFTMPDDAADPKQYEKLIPMPYDADWMDFGNIGDHIGAMGRTFAHHVISPILQDREPPPRRRSPTSRPSTTAPQQRDSSSGKRGGDAPPSSAQC